MCVGLIVADLKMNYLRSVDKMNLKILLFPVSATYNVLSKNATAYGDLNTRGPPNDSSSSPNVLNL